MPDQDSWLHTPSDGLMSETSTSQRAVEDSIVQLLREHSTSLKYLSLNRSNHIDFLTRMLRNPLPSGYTALDASRPWLLYWCLHSLAMLDVELDLVGRRRVISTLRQCQNASGGFGGGPGQMSHLAPTYAAVAALSYTGEDGYAVIDRKAMHGFLLRLKQPDGSFLMHNGGEVDVRGTYCALSVATLLNLLTPNVARYSSTFIRSCQTYEGGLASSAQTAMVPKRGKIHKRACAPTFSAPLGEAHGGYAFCAAASWGMLLSSSSLPNGVCPSEPAYSTMSISKQDDLLDLKSLLRWAINMQAQPIEGGGFRGRTNKLVDGCYSWWNGALFGVIESLMAGNMSEVGKSSLKAYDRDALQEYVLLIAQHPNGGLRDKPGKPADAYHTCYNLSGLSSAQHWPYWSNEEASSLERRWKRLYSEGPKSLAAGIFGQSEASEILMITDPEENEVAGELRMKSIWSRALAWHHDASARIAIGEPANLLKPTHPLLNICTEQTIRMMNYFYLQ